MLSGREKKRIQTKLLLWFKKNGRSLPWRETRDPYAIWVSEIMLQQTQVATVIPYYQRFLSSFPSVRHLAGANLSRVLKVWEGLGYYSRARNLHRASQIVLERFAGKVPDTFRGLVGLPGIGRYTAGAILSIAYNKEAPILDGNVRRVLSRLLAISKESPGEFWEISEGLVPGGKAGSFNQALMDLGSMICTPTGPSCTICPLRHVCKAKAEGAPQRYPGKKKRKEIPSVRGVTAVIRWGGKVLIHQRPPTGFLGGLWEFPNWRIKNERNLRRSLKHSLKKGMDKPIEIKKSLGVFQQTFSHLRLTLHAYTCEATGITGGSGWVAVENLARFPMARIHRRIAETISGQGASNLKS